VVVFTVVSFDVWYLLYIEKHTICMEDKVFVHTSVYKFTIFACFLLIFLKSVNKPVYNFIKKWINMFHVKQGVAVTWVISEKNI